MKEKHKKECEHRDKTTDSQVEAKRKKIRFLSLNVTTITNWVLVSGMVSVSVSTAQNSPSPALVLIFYFNNRNRRAFVCCCAVGTFVILIDERNDGYALMYVRNSRPFPTVRVGGCGRFEP